MTRKSLGTCVLLLGLLLGTSSAAYADAFVITSVTLTNFQLVPASGTVVFSGPQAIAHTVVVNGVDDESASTSQTLPLAQANSGVNGGSASALSNFTNLSITTSSNVMLSGCNCSAEAEGLAILRSSVMVVGGTGNVSVNVSGLLQTIQDLVTDQLSLFAASDIDITVKVADVTVFAFDPRLHIFGNEDTTYETQRQLSQAITLLFNQPYNVDIFVRVNSRAAQTEIPEPATVVLLGSGLGLMTAFVRRRRIMRSPDLRI